MNKKETELKQILMQKDKEQLVELYLQMKWERDYLQEELNQNENRNNSPCNSIKDMIKNCNECELNECIGCEYTNSAVKEIIELKTKNERLENKCRECKRLNYKIELNIKDKLMDENSLLKQQLKEKEQQLDAYQTFMTSGEYTVPSVEMFNILIQANTKQTCEKIKFLARARGIFGQKSKDMDYNQFNDILKQVEEDKDNN